MESGSQECLVAGWGGANSAPSSVEALFVAALAAVGQQTKDGRAPGFAALFSAVAHHLPAQRAEAAAASEEAVKHFAAAPQLPWQAVSLSELGLSGPGPRGRRALALWCQPPPEPG